MEHSSNTAAAALATVNNDRQIIVNAQPLLMAPKKNRGAMHILKVALYMLRRKSGKSKTSIHVDVASKGPWKKVLGSIRPLHIQSNQSPPKYDIEAPAPVIEQFEEVFTPNEASPSTTPCSSVDGMSQYSSALNLQELDVCTEEENEEEDNVYMHYDEDVGDEMIDAKAEEFISNFYEQMKIQQRDYMSRQNSYSQGRQTHFMRV